MQLPLFGRQMQAELARTEHGGDHGRGRRKLERPVSTRRPMHVVLTSHRARGPWSLRKHDRAMRDILRSMARRFDIRIYDFANVGSHLHIVLRARRPDAFQGFLRSFAGIVARRITGARRAHPSGRFFTGLAWTRVVNWWSTGVAHLVLAFTHARADEACVASYGTVGRPSQAAPAEKAPPATDRIAKD